METDLSGAREAEAMKKNRGIEEEHCFNPSAGPSYSHPSESLTRGSAKSLSIPIIEETRYMAIRAAR